jgi:alpha-tubulin suppressor-like RCC1 family protein
MVYEGNITSFATGAEHSAMVRADGSLWTFGKNNYGQLGDGNTTDRLSPVKILDENVTEVAAGWNHTLFLKSDGSVWSMGRNNWGQLGDGTQIDRNIPVRVINGNATGVVCGNHHSFILMKDGSLLGFGNNGNARTGFIYNGVNNLTTPQLVFPSGVADVAGGDQHSLFLMTDGSLWSAGNSEYGRTGFGSFPGSHNLIKIVDSGIAGIAAGRFHSVYWKSNGEVYVFGGDRNGQLGLGQVRFLSTPQTLDSSH